MAQWTIASVLTIGGALIGFNWLQNQGERERIRQAHDEVIALADTVPKLVEDVESRINQRLLQLEGVVLFSWDVNMGIQMLDEARQHSHPLDPTVAYFSSVFVNAGDNFQRKRGAMQLIAYSIDRDLKKGVLHENDRNAVYRILPDLWHFDQAMANHIVRTLEQMRQDQQNEPGPVGNSASQD